MENGDLAWDQVLEIDDKYINYSRDMSVSNIALKENVDYTLTDMMNAALVPSSNSATVYLAELVAGDSVAYNKKANEKLASWGIENADWSSASGLPVGALGPFETNTHEQDTVNRLTSREVGIIAARLVHDYPHILEITSQEAVRFPESNPNAELLVNTNKLLSDVDYQVDGLKTGSLPEYGRNLVTKTEIHGVPVISVVLGAAANNKDVVFNTTKSLWQQAAERLEANTLKKGDVFDVVSVKEAESGEIKAAFNQNVMYLGAKDEAEPSIKQVNLNTQVPAKGGEVIGKAKLNFSGDNDVLWQELSTFNVQTNTDVQRANWFVRTWRNIFG